MNNKVQKYTCKICQCTGLYEGDEDISKGEVTCPDCASGINREPHGWD